MSTDIRGDVLPPSDLKHDPEAVSSDVESDNGTSGIDTRQLIAKLDFHLLPTVSFLYLLSFLDRSNVANARIEGLTTATAITGNQYLTGLTLYFIGYVLFEIPCNIILKKTTPRFWLPTLTIVWGIVATFQGIIHNLSGYFAVRFFLGVAESGLFPGVVWYLSMWYRRSERQFRVALFFSAASLAGAFGGILAWAIAHMNGVAGLGGWQWIFILEGIFTVIAAIPAYWLITNWPSTAHWLSPAEKSHLHARLAADSDATNHEGFTWTNVLAALRDPKCWLYAAAFHTMSLPLYILSLFLPSIITALGYTSAAAQLLTIPPYALACLLTIVTALLSQRLKRRAPFIIAHALLGCVGYAVLLSSTNPTRNPGQSYAGTFLAAAGIYPATALVLAWPAGNVSGQTKRAVSNALQISIGNLGAVLGTQLYRPATAPRYVLGHSFALAYMAANVLVTGTLWFVLSRENRRRDAIVELRERDGKGLPEGPFEGDEDLRWRFQV